MAFLRNTWYVAAYPEDVTRALFARQIIGDLLVFFRREDGSVAALRDMCPHRFAPLSRGRLEGDLVECPYHGLRFDGGGRCAFNPHAPGKIPEKMAVRSYPVVERHSLIWIWMGDSARADPAAIPDLSYLTDTKRWRTVRGYFHMPFGADLMVDNLMDMSHVEFVHKGTLSGGHRPDLQTTMTIDEEPGNTVRVKLLVKGVESTPLTRMTRDVAERIDSYRDTVWQPPGVMRNELVDVPTGQPRSEARLRFHTHCLTPETHRSMHDFALRSRNFALDDEALDERLIKSQRPVVVEEDGALLEQVQMRMGDAPFEELDPVMFNVDTGAARVRRIMQRLVAAEQKESAS